MREILTYLVVCTGKLRTQVRIELVEEISGSIKKVHSLPTEKRERRYRPMGSGKVVEKKGSMDSGKV